MQLQERAYAGKHFLFNTQPDDQIEMAVMISATVVFPKTLVLVSRVGGKQIEQLAHAVMRALLVAITGNQKDGCFALGESIAERSAIAMKNTGLLNSSSKLQNYALGDGLKVGGQQLSARGGVDVAAPSHD